ncbi:L-fucose/L-arabinose isomerase family protein [Enterococcus gilvus]|uniref:L-fucose isomerase C-terminal domain-containing protein n=1 Tax=Enterococcus gilvus ATCC BAA-350 TaxID=1158614 RepID=R2XKF3_9ENTE|nr:hypothetical protein [Enterococcus gilvus]EOI55424.1 hypothetical protein UKC_02632 [Enterococcus gilvus ATCC BAA-350]EOW82033.1 hypothetical protein I592_01334 [Enterococcus gilvus ATCC BAA-350]OJG43062.1 hypothetical protein RV02_GL002982 [Enterococcus gilvus]
MLTKVLFLPTARLTFDVELAENIYSQSKELLLNMEGIQPIIPEGLLTDPDMLVDFINVHGLDADVILFQDTTFTDGEFIQNAIDLVNVPVIIWGLKEPSIGGRLRLNSLTGVMSTANVLHNNKRPYLYTRGNPEEKATKINLEKQINVLSAIKKVKNLTIGVIGNYPGGFFFSGANEMDLRNAFGVDLKHYELHDWFDLAKEVNEEEYQSEIDFAEKQIIGLNRTDHTVKRFAQFVKVAKDYIRNDGLSAIAMRCWPDFFVELKAAPCGAFSQLTEQGFPTACEADIHGSLSMYILQMLSKGNAPYMGDVVNIVPENNSIILWHCGFAPYSIANPKTGATAGVHPNRKIGLAMDFGIKPGEVTLFRVGYGPEGYRFVITKGNALDVPNSYLGTSAEIKLDKDADEFVTYTVEQGIEPHFAMIHGDVTKELVEMARVLNIETLVY